MRGRASFLRVSVAVGGLLGLSGSLSCSSTSTPTTGSGLTLTPTVVVPKDLIGEIAVFSLQVYPALPAGGTAITCNATTGAIGGGLTGVKGLARPDGGPDLSASASCALGVERCFTNVTLPQSTSMVLSITGYRDAAATSVLAVGCATLTTTTAATATATVTLHPTESCGDGMLEPPETCDPASGTTDEECSMCQTNIDLLSSGNGAGMSNTVTGSPGDKRDPSFLWPTGGGFLAFFSDDSTNSAATEQISMRVRGPTFAPTSSGNITDTESIYVPNTPNAFPPAAEAFDHKQPVAVQSGGDTYVVFAYDASGSYSIVLRSMTASFDAVQATPCAISDSSAGESGNLTAPAVAVSSINGSDVFYIAWQDDSGRIYGRTYTPNATGACSSMLGPQTLLSSGSSNSHVSVAGITSGWAVTWQSGTQVVLRLIGTGGAPASPQGMIDSGADPTVSAIPGTNDYALAWANTTNSVTSVFAERCSGSTYLDSGPVAVSQSTNGGGEITPFIAGTPAVGGSYVVTWVDQGGNQEIRARLLAGVPGKAQSTWFLTNAIDGTTNEFVVSDTASRTRVSPTVAVGGTSPGYVAFGWADNSTSGTFGILARRFPLPTQ